MKYIYILLVSLLSYSPLVEHKLHPPEQSKYLLLHLDAYLASDVILDYCTLDTRSQELLPPFSNSPDYRISYHRSQDTVNKIYRVGPSY